MTKFYHIKNELAKMKKQTILKKNGSAVFNQ